MGEEAGSSDIVIAYLPNASMGTALEMIRSHDDELSCVWPGIQEESFDRISCVGGGFARQGQTAGT